MTMSQPSARVIPVDFWLLCATANPAPSDLQLCRTVLDAHRTDAGAFTAIDELARAGRPIAVEMAADNDYRVFRFPHQPQALSLREDTFGACGFGHRVWEAGVALAIWLSLNPSMTKGRRVLELGSGVGIGGIAAALQQPESVTLSDVDGPDAPLLLENLRANAAANRVAAATRALDWHDCLQEQGAPEEVYDVVLASDCIYYPSDAAALAAALRRHLRPGGIAVLFNRVGREGDPAGAFLQTLRELELGPVETEDLWIVSNYGAEALHTYMDLMLREARQVRPENLAVRGFEKLGKCGWWSSKIVRLLETFRTVVFDEASDRYHANCLLEVEIQEGDKFPRL